MTDDHARAAKIDQLQGELGWQKQLAAQAVRERRATQQLLNMEREKTERLEKERDELRRKVSDLMARLGRMCGDA